MSTTTGADLLAHADRLTRQLRASEVPVTRVAVGDLRRHPAPAPPRARPPRPGPRRPRATRPGQPWPPPSAPTPTRSAPSHHRPLSPREAAQQLGQTTAWVHAQIRRGNLHAVHDGRDTYIPAEALDTRSDITPAAPTDPHPLARLATTLGALADLLHDHTDRPPLPAEGHSAGAAVHVLAIGAVAARHTLTHGPIADANRPLAIAQYAERVIDTLHEPAQLPHHLDRIAAVTPSPAPETLNDRLEAAIYDWSCRRARGDPTPHPQRRRPPGLRQPRHPPLCRHPPTPPGDLVPGPESEAATETAVHLTKAGQSLRDADKAWAGLTTATRPTHEFVTASRALFATLQDMTTAIETAPKALDKDRALGDLARAADRLTELLVATEHLPERLVQSGLLYAPATKAQPAPERLNDRAKGRLVIVRTLDTPELTDRWHEAVGASREAAQIVGHLRAQRPAPAPADRAITRLAVLEP